jgi:hypothetical protein
LISRKDFDLRKLYSLILAGSVSSPPCNKDRWMGAGDIKRFFTQNSMLIDEQRIEQVLLGEYAGRNINYPAFAALFTLKGAKTQVQYSKLVEMRTNAGSIEYNMQKKRMFENLQERTGKKPLE